MKNLRYITYIFSLLLAMTACVKEEPVTISFSAVEYDVTVGDTLDLGKEVIVVNATGLPQFTVDNEELVSFTSTGVLVAESEGEVRVTAHLEEVSAGCLVKIAHAKLDTLIVNAPRVMVVDSVRSVTVTVKPEKYDKNKLQWKFEPTDPALIYEANKVSASEYALKIKNFVQDAKLAITVSDSLSQKSQTAYVGVSEDGTPAESVVLELPDQLTEGLKTRVKATVYPNDYDPKYLNWTFNPSSQEVDFKWEKISDLEYEVSFGSYLKGGRVTIIATDRLSANEGIGEVKVLKKPRNGVVRLNLELDAYKQVGFEPFELDLITEPEDYDPLLLEWTSSDETVATVENGVVTVLSQGETVIKVKDTVSGKGAECVVTIVEPVDADVRKIELSQTSIEVQVGEPSVQLVATCYDVDGKVVENYSGLEWEVESNENDEGKAVIELSNQGVVTPLNRGMVQVYVRNEIAQAICHVTVKRASVKVQKIKLSPTEKVISVGKTFQLKADVLPEDAEDKSVTFYSSNESIATVTSDGIVKGIAKGKTYISALTSNGVESECEVTVADAWVEFTPEVLTLVEGETFALKAKVQPEGVDGGNLTWSSSDPSVVTVDATGQLKALSPGEVEIKVVTSNGIEGTCTVTVLREFGINIEILSEDVKKYGVHQFESFEMRVSYTDDFVPEKTEWVPSDPSVLKITKMEESGRVLVEAVYEGKIPSDEVLQASITHKVSNKEKTVTVDVLPARPTKLIVNALPENNVIYLGETFDFNVQIEPSQAPQEVTTTGTLWFDQPLACWHTSTIVTPTKSGVFDVLFAASSATSVQSETYQIAVKGRPVSGGTLNRENLSLTVGETARLSVNLQPYNDWRYDNSLKWSSSNSAVASVDGGVVKACMEGTAVISVELSNGMALNCNVTVGAPRDSKVAVGDFYYSDGTTSSELDASKTVVGIVFSVKNPSLQDDALSAEYNRGLAVSLTDIENTPWQQRKADSEFLNVSAWLVENKGYLDLASTTYECGYSNTLALKQYNQANPNDKVLVVEDIPLGPELTSGWYIPSYAEFMLMYNNRVRVMESMTVAGGKPFPQERNYNYGDGGTLDGPCYWTSTESATSSTQAAAVNFHDEGGVKNNVLKSKNFYRVRYIFAF